MEVLEATGDQLRVFEQLEARYGLYSTLEITYWLTSSPLTRYMHW